MRAILTLLAAALAFGSAADAQPASGPLAVKAADPALAWGPCPPIFGAGCAIAVLHGDPAKPNADVFLRVDGGKTLAAHTHTSAERMVLVSGRLRVDYKGSAPVTLAAGDYAYGPAGSPHSAACVGTERCVLFIAFEGPVDAHAHDGGVE
jgi:quercetin dioxygenase-like cupin family protein